MRKRWKAGMVGASALALGTAASLAQRPEAPPRPTVGPVVGAVEIHPLPVQPNPAEAKRWRSRLDPQAKPASESQPGLSESANPLPEARPAPGIEDPSATVDAFLQRNRKEADDSIQALNREAEALRARLARVEAGLVRWRAVSAALNAEAKRAPVASTVAPDPAGPISAPPTAVPPSLPGDPPPDVPLPPAPNPPPEPTSPGITLPD